ncbi:hypothetical protein OF83DRAFT_1120014 [Amylostereum chailletii]|nr:hypothetical protein OF83DRAFT_1120014 [Amylostereum chailletii]
MSSSTSTNPHTTERKMKNRERHIKDPIHDYMEFGPHIWKVVDTRHFQRLRQIKQLGTSYYVWSGASHNRFEHSLGTAYLARQMAVHLKDTQPELGITERDVRCVELAGVCHDLGHGPWSHVWDSMYIPRALKDKQWQHEDASEMMFDDMVAKYEIDLEESDVRFIKALIAGDKARCANEKPFLFEIVANKRNGIDVDKFDYIARDGRAIGDQQNLSLARLIKSARVIENQICYDIKDANQIYELCYTRFSLHKRIYNHKTAKAIEFMLIDGVMAAEPSLKIAEQIDNPDKYLDLTDNIMPFILMSTDPDLQLAREIFTRVQNRDLYKCVDYKAFDFDDCEVLHDRITAEAIVEEAKKLTPGKQPRVSKDDDDVEWGEEGDEDELDPEVLAELTPNDVCVALSTMHYGMKDRNPLDFVRFYSKQHPNKCAKAGRGDLSLLMPEKFAEVLLRVYTKHARFSGIVQAGYRALVQRVVNEHHDESQPPSPTAATLVEPPSTPRARSRVRSLRKLKSFSNASMPPGEDKESSPMFNDFTTLPRGHGHHSPGRATGGAVAPPFPLPPPSPTRPSVDQGNAEPQPLFPVAPLRKSERQGARQVSGKRGREDAGAVEKSPSRSPPKKKRS